MNLRTWAMLVAMMVWLGGALRGVAAEPTSPNDPRLDWWRQARFGLFIHWGPVSLRGTEIGWSRGAQVPTEEYDQLYRRFNPTNFDARAWAKLAREAGTRYVVLTSKHHDGFALWPSELTDYDIAATPFRRDVAKELGDACRHEKLVYCFYHSVCDWHHPDYPLGSPGGQSAKPNPNLPRYVEYLHGQLRELITRYGPLGVLWFDGEWEKPWNEPLGRELYDFVRGLQPSILINNRVSPGRSDNSGGTKAGMFASDFDTPEQQIGRFNNQRPWESCITIGEQWSWKPDDAVKPLAQCLRTLSTCAGGDGNLLLNVGPRPDGTIEPRQVERLREIGAWLKVHGPAIYDTRGGPFKPGAWGASTHRGQSLFVHAFAWPNDQLVLPALPARVRSARLLGGGGRAEFRADGSQWILRVPAARRDPSVTVIELRLDTPVQGLPVTEVGDHPR